MTQDENKKVVIEKMREALARQGLSASKLASELELKRSTVVAWFTGRNWPSISNREKIAEHLGRAHTVFYTQQEIDAYKTRREREFVPPHATQVLNPARFKEDLASALNIKSDAVRVGDNLAFHCLDSFGDWDTGNLTRPGTRSYAIYSSLDRALADDCLFVVFLLKEDRPIVCKIKKLIGDEGNDDRFLLTTDHKQSLKRILTSSQFHILGKVLKIISFVEPK